MVVPNRDLGNKQFSFSSAFITSTITQIAQFPASNLAIDIDDADNSNNVRRRSHFSSKASSKYATVSSSTSSIPYNERIEINNNLLDDDFKDSIDSS